VHDLLKLLAVASLSQAGLRVSNEEVAVDHFVQDSLLELVGGPEFQQGLGQFDAT
jgi:hypothetical protein